MGQIESLEDQLLDMQTNSIPLAEYSVLAEQLASETANVRRTAERDLTARFQQQDRIISSLRREKQELKAALLTAEAASEDRMCVALWAARARVCAARGGTDGVRLQDVVREGKRDGGQGAAGAAPPRKRHLRAAEPPEKQAQGRARGEQRRGAGGQRRAPQPTRLLRAASLRLL